LGRLRQPAAIGAKILQVAQRQTGSRIRPGARPPAHAATPGDAEDRLTRGTEVAAMAADADIAAVVREAATALDEQTREALDLHYRQGLSVNEVAAVIGGNADAVRETIAKLPTAMSVLTRSRVLWRGGQPLDAELAELLDQEHVTSFDAGTVRIINK